MTGRVRPLPTRDLLAFAAVTAAVAAAARIPAVASRVDPSLVAAAIFLYVPLFRYRARGAPSWLGAGRARGLAVLLLLGGAGTGAFLLARALPLPPALAPPAAPPSSLPATLLWQAAAVALPEEVFFRGYLYDAFEEAGWAPVVPAAVLFAAAHVAIAPTPYRALTVLPGLLFGLGRKWTGTLWVPVLLHLLFNLLPHLPGGP